MQQFRPLTSLLRLLAVGLLALSSACATTPQGERPSVADAPDPRLRSAGLLRASGEDHAPSLAPAAEVARLKSHFDAVLEKLEADTPQSLDQALQRLVVAGIPVSTASIQELRRELAIARERQLSLLRGYRDAGLFPVNHELAERAVPIFVDPQDTACAVGFLMRASGWGEGVAEIAASNNQLFVEDARVGPLLAWVATSGLTREEAALIQPTYQPPLAEAFLDDLVSSGSGLMGSELSYSGFAFDAVVVGPGGESPAPTSLVDPADFGLTNFGNGLFIGSQAVGGLAAPPMGFGDDGSLLRIQVAYDVQPIDVQLGIDEASFRSFDYFIFDGNFADPGQLTLESRIFDGDTLIASMLLEGSDFPSGVFRDFDAVSFGARASVRVETEAIIRAPIAFSYFIHDFSLTAIPEPGTGTLLGVGLLFLTRCRPRTRR